MPTLNRVLGTSSIPLVRRQSPVVPAEPRHGHTPPHTSPSCLGGEAQLPDVQNLAKSRFRRKTRHAVPASYSARDFAEAGGLMGYGTNIADAWR